MNEITITEVLDDLRVADQITRHYERRYWLSSGDFYSLYSQGLLDDGENSEDFAEWSAYYQIKLDRERALKELSEKRMNGLKRRGKERFISITPPEPTLHRPATS